ncbi:GumC family protein [Sinimarinibacterium thermocellulolyticum]|uniref:Polysaccharide biosynthesis tyrosine autokinase n=1 Tax=Sinimarinibacterium thermocellulolyticum TaxID=3170016 RepID=A0ABV2AAU9_9GAMM
MSRPPIDGGAPSPLRILWLSAWQILGLAVIGAGLGAAYSLWVEPEYEATTTLLIEPKEANVVEIDKVYDSSSVLREYQRTQYELLRSRELAAAIVESLRLEAHPAYAEEVARMRSGETSFKARIAAFVEKHAPELYTALNLETHLARRESLLDRVIEQLSVRPVPNTYLVDVSFRSPDPQLAADVANEVVTRFVERERAARAGITQEAAGWLTERLEDSRKALQASEARLQQFLEQQNLVNVGGARGLVEDELTEQTRRLREARLRREQLANVYNKIRAAGRAVELLQEIPLIQEDPLVRDTKAAYLAAKEALEQLGPRYGVKHPTRVTAQARFDAARNAYFTQLRIRADGLRSEYELADRTVADLQAIVDRSTERIQNLDRKDYELRVLEREVQANRELYETFLRRYKETEATTDLQPGNVRVIDRALVPNEPVWPKPLLLIVACGVLGLFTGCGLVLLRETLDDSVKTTEELESLTGTPILCSLPKLSGSKSAAEKLVRMELDDPKSTYAEGIRTLRTSVLLSDGDARPTRRIMVCSSLPEEGKTSISSNLAIVLAEREKVLLIDTDLRKPRLATLFGLPASPGLWQVLSGDAPLDACIQSFPEGHLHVMTAGSEIRNPQVMLASERFRALLDTLSARYERIVFDTPPVQLVSDALLFARMMDAVILVARANGTARKIVASAARHLRGAEAPLLGAVLNQVDIRRARSSEGGYYYRYGYYG